MNDEVKTEKEIYSTDDVKPAAENIYHAVLRIVAAVPYVPKDIQITGANSSYKAVSAANIMDKTRALMIEEGIVMFPSHYEMTRDGSTTSVTVDYVFHHVPTKTEIVVASVGQGTDKFDKGAGKASTYADKYAVMRLFRIVTGDDPDHTGNEVHQQNNDELMVKYKELERRIGDLKADGVIDDAYFQSANKALKEFLQRKDFAGMEEAEKTINGIGG